MFASLFSARRAKRTRVSRTVATVIESLERRRLLSVSGAIFTTDSTGSLVNGNIYDAKQDVYLNGGPIHVGAAGLNPETDYYVQITDPSGATLLGTSVTVDDGTPIHTDADGEVDLVQLWSILDSDGDGTADGYLDTPNAGGEYKVWISTDSAFTNSETKTDNFKVKSSTPPTSPQGFLYGIKFEDHNGNGVQDDPDDQVLANWAIYLDDDNDGTLDWTDGNSNKVWDPGEGEQWTITSSLGLYSFVVSAGSGVSYQVREAGLIDGDGDIIPTGTAGWTQTTTDPSPVTSVGDGELVHAGDFGNFENIAISGQKFRDADTDGVKDAGEQRLGGWTIFLDADNDGVFDAGETSTTTDASGNYSFTNLGPGTYVVREVQQTNWIRTTTNPAAIVAASGTDATDIDFGNVRLGAGGGLTLGFWSNQNGQRILTGSATGKTISASYTALLNGLNLRTATGSNFDLAATNNYATFRNWLLGATATNMAYMLSAQLATMSLNVAAGFVSGSALIYAPGTLSANAAGFATVSAIITEANTELGVHGYTVASGSIRTYQEKLKIALDNANNNLNFVVP